MKAFTVYLDGKKIDRVFFNSDDTDEVRLSLIEWDGYDPDIEVRSEFKKSEVVDL
jgi:hypothetical protein